MIMYKIVLSASECTVKVWDASLVVVDTHGRKGIGRVLMGSSTEQMISLSTCPVLVIRNAQSV
jgi:nucleotide-binding universal stress UspA family protein